eukprot:g16210.t1
MNSNANSSRSSTRGSKKMQKTGTSSAGHATRKDHHFRLLLRQNYRELFRCGCPLSPAFDGLLNNVINLLVLCGFAQFAMMILLQPINGSFSDEDDEKPKPNIYSVFSVGSYEQWPDANKSSVMFNTYLSLMIIGAITYAGFFYSGLIAATYGHVFSDRFSGMGEVVQIYGVEAKTYWGAKLFSLWSFLFFQILIAYLCMSIVPSVLISRGGGESESGSMNGPSGLKDQTVFSLLTSMLAMGFFPCFAGLFFAAWMGLTVGQSAGQAETYRQQLCLGGLLIFLIYGFVELFFQQPAGFSPQIADQLMDSSTSSDRKCVLTNSYNDGGIPTSKGFFIRAYFGTFLHFVFGVMFPGYTATKLWIDQSVFGVVLRQAHAKHADASTQVFGEDPRLVSSVDARSVFWCAFTGRMRPETEEVYGKDTDVAKTFGFVTSQNASTYAERMGVHYYIPLTADLLAAVFNVLLWGVLFVRAARKQAAASGEEVATEASVEENEIDNGDINARGQVIQTLQPRIETSDEQDQSKTNLALEIKAMSKSYDGGKKFANTEVSFSVRRGEIFALLGHNGAGKTTLLRQITAMVPPTKGDAFINGVSVKHAPAEVRKHLAFCPQQNPMWLGYTLRDHLLFFAALGAGTDNPDNQVGNPDLD